VKPRTHEEIAAYLKENESFFGFTEEALLPFLPFEHARPWLKDEATAEEWGDAKPNTVEAIVAEMRGYMDFAWGKVRDERGLSACRSVEKMHAWMWALGDDEALAEFERASGDQYGAAKLFVVCVRYGFEVPTWVYDELRVAAPRIEPLASLRVG
jgi:hypothetical protein